MEKLTLEKKEAIVRFKNQSIRKQRKELMVLYIEEMVLNGYNIRNYVPCKPLNHYLYNVIANQIIQLHMGQFDKDSDGYKYALKDLKESHPYLFIDLTYLNY